MAERSGLAQRQNELAPNAVITISNESRVETKLARGISNLTITEEDSFDKLLGKFNL